MPLSFVSRTNVYKPIDNERTFCYYTVTNKRSERVVEMRNFRIVSKVRFTIFLVVVMLLASSLISFIDGSAFANSLSSTQYYCVEIESGDTLWDIAAEYGPDRMDVRKVVYDICAVNEISGDDIEAGQNILVPVYN